MEDRDAEETYFHCTLFEIFFFLATLRSSQDLSFPDQGSNPCPLQWQRSVLTSGPAGKSHSLNFLNL